MDATEAHHAKEVLDVVLPADHQSTKRMQPSEEPFHSPTPAVLPQRATIMCGFQALSAMGATISMPYARPDREACRFTWALRSKLSPVHCKSGSALPLEVFLNHDTQHRR